MLEELNDEQLIAATSNERTILCIAGAGAGKTKTLLARIERLVSEGVDPRSILVLTFTNAAAFDMKERYKKSPTLDISKGIPEFRTFHSFCYSLIIKDADVRTRLGYTKVPEVCDDARFKDLKSRVKLQIGCTLPDSVLENDVELSMKDKAAKELYQKALIKTIKKENLITFDIMCYNVCALFEKNDDCILKYKQKYKYVFVDEMQDSDPKQFKFISSFPATTNFYLCGDALQCQPSGTKILMCDGTVKNIEDVQVGDQVVTYNAREGQYNTSTKFNVGRQVTQVANRYADNIVEVRSANHRSRYTKDHITYCKIHYEGNENKKCIYLMHNSKKGWWRIGQCSLFISGGLDFGPKGRLAAEKGDQVWILDICSTYSGQAWLAEQTAAFKFGIPDTTWEYANCHNYAYNEESLAALYEQIPDIRDRAIACLEFFGRDIRYPFCDKTIVDRRHMSKLHCFETRVGNLIPGLMDIVVPQRFTESTYKYKRNTLHNTYEVIEEIVPCDPEIVYSLDVGTHHNYVADGILTHNCIYQFRGCTNEYVKTLATAPGWKVIRLRKNYRSVKKICDFANKFSIYAPDSYRITMEGQRDGGSVEVIYGSNSSYNEPVDKSHLRKLIDKLTANPDESAILCRTNKEVGAVKKALDEAKIEYSASNKSRDVISYLDAASSNDFMLEWLSSMLEARDYGDYLRMSAIVSNPDITWFLNNYGNVTKIKEAVSKISHIRKIVSEDIHPMDKFEKITKLLRVKTKCTFEGNEFTTNKEIIDSIRSQLEAKEENKIYVGTIHSAKGLEYNTVYVMGVNDSLFQLGSEEMNNLYYVAITRPKEHLVVFRK